MSDWEIVIEYRDHKTERLKVEGGYLYHRENKDTAFAPGQISSSMSFVPLPSKCEYHNQHRLYVCAECYQLEQDRNKA